MRNFIKIVENADADDMYGDAARMDTFGRQNGQEFADRGRGDIKIKPNNPRFADNAMADPQELDEFADDHTQVDIIHQELNGIGMTDLEIRQGVELNQSGKQKLAAKLGCSPDEVHELIGRLIQDLRDADSEQDDALLSDYYSFMGESEKKPAKEAKKGKKRPFDQGVMSERISYEADFLGNYTVRDSETGEEKFVQGTEASELADKLKHDADPNNQQENIREFAEPMNSEEPKTSFADEINASAGTYNFPWDYQGEHGLATVFYRTDLDTPHLKLKSVRDLDGLEFIADVDPEMHDDLLRQAQDFIGDE